MAATAEAVWAVARSFGGHWHPLVEEISVARRADGRLVRSFRVRDDESHYQEQLTYFSDSDRELRYAHVQGIRDVSFYRATLRVLEEAGQTVVEWQAAFEAPEPRASAIASGTQAVFDMGIAALETMATPTTTVIPGVPGLAVTQTAEKPGPLVLFLHGIGGNRGNWRRQLGAASRHHQAVAVDLRGYGGSARGPAQSKIGDHCNDILRVLDHLGKRQVILCGMSLGSWIATSFAMHHGNRLAGLVLSGGCTGMSEASAEERKSFLAARQKPLDDGLTPRDFAGGVVKVICGPHASAEVMRELEQSMAAIPAASYRDALWCFTHPEERFDFARITCPVLMMTGEHDRLAPPPEIRSVAQRIHGAAQNPDVNFEIIPGAGHLCNIENPEDYNHHLMCFLERFAT